jgi:competence protein ComEC
MLIDAGRDRTVMHELGDIMPINKKTIDFIEVSNPDLDHIGGFPFVMEKYKVREILSPGTKHDSLDSYKAIEKIAKEDKIPVIRPKTGQIITIDNKSSITYKILWPEGNVNNWEVNAGSMVGLLEYSGHKILFTGDAPKEVEDQIILKYGASLKNIDILKVGHHGSKTSTGGALAMLARPKYSIISVGLNNRYGHPHQETLDTLNLVHSKILITANDGRIVCKVWIKKETVCT